MSSNVPGSLPFGACQAPPHCSLPGLLSPGMQAIFSPPPMRRLAWAPAADAA